MSKIRKGYSLGGNRPKYNLDKANKKDLKTYSDSIVKSIEAVVFIDFMQKSLGWNRQERRGFWRDFVGSPAFRVTYLEGLREKILDR